MVQKISSLRVEGAEARGFRRLQASCGFCAVYGRLCKNGDNRGENNPNEGRNISKDTKDVSVTQ